MTILYDRSPNSYDLGVRIYDRIFRACCENGKKDGFNDIAATSVSFSFDGKIRGTLIFCLTFDAIVCYL